MIFFDHTLTKITMMSIFFLTLISKSSCFLSAEHAVLETYYTAHRQLTFKRNSQNSTSEPTQLKQLLLIAFNSHTNLEPVNCSNKQLKLLRTGHNKSYNISWLLSLNVWPKIGLHFTHHTHI